MSNCIILGDRSDIAQGLRPLLEQDGWNIRGIGRSLSHLLSSIQNWDLLLCCMGKVSPVGLWNMLNWHSEEIDITVQSNLLVPIDRIAAIWNKHNPGASICFLAGSNPNMIMPGYFAYNVSKMALLKAVEQMDAETPDAKFFALGPGTIITKIHKATLDAGWDNPKLKAALDRGEDKPEIVQAKIARVYECLKWCIAQPKEVIGGRNICVSDPWDQGWLERWLKANPDLYKLRRMQ